MEYEDLKIIEEKAAALGALADGVWEHPETAFTEFVSAGLLADFLEKEGFAVTRGVADIPTAFSTATAAGTTCWVSARWLRPWPSSSICSAPGPPVP